MSSTPFTGYEPNSNPLLAGSQAMQIDGSVVPLPPTPPGTQQNLAFIPGPSSDHQSLIVMPSSSSSVQPPPISMQAQVPTQMLLTNPQASTAHVSGSPKQAHN